MQFELKATFAASPQTIYDTWLDTAGHIQMTGAEAIITPGVGDSFTAWNGYISGKNEKLEPGRTIIQSWRTTEFGDDEPDSRVEITLEPHEEGTLLTLQHSGLSEAGEQYIQGWEDYYFTPMEEYFGG